MKLTFAVLAVLLASAYGAPSVEGEPNPVDNTIETELVTDEAAITKLEEILKEMKDDFGIRKQEPAMIFEGLVVEPLNKKCVIDRMRNMKNFDEIFTTEGIHFEGKRFLKREGIYFIIALIDCNEKLDDILGLAYDFQTNFGTLYRMFKDSESFAEIIDIIACVNNYAIENHAFDPEKIHVKYDVTDKRQCRKISVGLDQLYDTDDILEAFPPVSRTCLAAAYKENLNLQLKYFSVVQQDMTPDQNEVAKNEYVDENHSFLSKLYTCLEKEPNFKGRPYKYRGNHNRGKFGRRHHDHDHDHDHHHHH